MKESSVESASEVRVRIAVGALARARGLISRPAPAPGCGLLLAGVRAVHGIGLRRPLDLVYLDDEGQVLACAVLRPWRVSMCRAACHVIEMRRGECERLGLVPGRRLLVTVVADIFGRSRRYGRDAAASSPRSKPMFAVAAVAMALASASCLASEAAGDAADGAAEGAANAQAVGSSVPAAVERHTGEPRRKRVRKARASLHRDAADGTPAKPLRKARPRRSRSRQAPVEYLVGEPERREPDRRR